MKKVVKTDGCWNWVGGQRGHGYGAFHPIYGENPQQAHRFSYETFKGKIPQGSEVDHLCSNRLCVNPDHLEAVTHKVNVLRGNTIAAKNSKKTHCPQGHKYDSKNTVIKMRNGRPGRHCLQCRLNRKKGTL